MVEIERSPQAPQNLESIADFIAKDSPHDADLFVADLFRALDKVAAFAGRTGTLAHA